MAGLLETSTAYMNVVLNLEANTDAGSKIAIVDDNSDNGKKIVATSVDGFSAGLRKAGPDCKVLKLKGFVDMQTLEGVNAALVSYATACLSISDIGLKTAEFAAGSEDAVRQLVSVLRSNWPGASIVPAKKVERLVSSFGSDKELAALILARVRASDSPTAAIAAPGGHAKAKVKVGQAEGASAWLDAAIASGGGVGGAGKVHLPGAQPGEPAVVLEIGPVTSVKIRGPVTEAAVGLALHLARTVPTLNKIAVVRYQAATAQARQLVEGLCSVCQADGRSLHLHVKREGAGGEKTKHSWDCRALGQMASAEDKDARMAEVVATVANQ